MKIEEQATSKIRRQELEIKDLKDKLNRMREG
jgi:hypothetical protein